MTAAEFARALGSAHRCGQWWRCRCPAHRSRSAALALRDGDRGLIIKCFARCDPRAVLAELRTHWLIGARREWRSGPRSSLPPVDDDSRRMAAAQRIWDAARDARGSPVEHYLGGRGIASKPLPPSLRWAPALRRTDDTHGPAMVARVDDINGELVAVHRTWIARDDAGIWRRRDRASLGPMGGGAVRLAPAAETLMVGEGLETCLSAMQATAMPAWAALSTSGLVGLALPPAVRVAIILADHDLNGAGERAARTAAARWLAEGRRVRIAMPPEPDTDFNDILLDRSHAGNRKVCDVAV